MARAPRALLKLPRVCGWLALQAMGVAVVKKRFVDLQRKVIWRLPERKLVRYVRIQLEQQNVLTLAQVSGGPGSASQSSS